MTDPATGLIFQVKFDNGHSLFRDGIGNMYIKDDSPEGPARVDSNKQIRVSDTSWLIPLVGGLCTPAPIEEAFHIAAETNMMIETPRTLWRVSEA